MRVVELARDWPRTGADADWLLHVMPTITAVLAEAARWALWFERSFDDEVTVVGAIGVSAVAGELRRVASHEIAGLVAWSVA